MSESDGYFKDGSRRPGPPNGCPKCGNRGYFKERFRYWECGSCFYETEKSLSDRMRDKKEEDDVEAFVWKHAIRPVNIAAEWFSRSFTVCQRAMDDDKKSMCQCEDFVPVSGEEDLHHMVIRCANCGKPRIM